MFVDSLLGLIAARGVHITHRDDLDVTSEEAPQQAEPLHTHADETHGQS
jgi:hypothetical protein